MKSSKLIIQNQKCKNAERFEDTVHAIGSDIRSSATDALFVPAPNTHHTCSPDLIEGFSGSKSTGLLSSGLPWAANTGQSSEKDPVEH